MKRQLGDVVKRQLEAVPANLRIRKNGDLRVELDVIIPKVDVERLGLMTKAAGESIDDMIRNILDRLVVDVEFEDGHEPTEEEA